MTFGENPFQDMVVSNRAVADSILPDLIGQFIFDGAGKIKFNCFSHLDKMLCNGVDQVNSFLWTAATCIEYF